MCLLYCMISLPFKIFFCYYIYCITFVIVNICRKDCANMSYRRIPDGDGHSITLFDRDGRLFLTQRMLKTWLPMTHMTSRDDDVLICAYPKSGRLPCDGEI